MKDSQRKAMFAKKKKGITKDKLEKCPYCSFESKEGTVDQYQHENYQHRCHWCSWKGDDLEGHEMSKHPRLYRESIGYDPDAYGDTLHNY